MTILVILVARSCSTVSENPCQSLHDIPNSNIGRISYIEGRVALPQVPGTLTAFFFFDRVPSGSYSGCYYSPGRCEPSTAFAECVSYRKGSVFSLGPGVELLVQIHCFVYGTGCGDLTKVFRLSFYNGRSSFM